ncbi:MAG TPA: helix-turn-helix transcriptional regulator [Gemmatimonadales bacterium]|nr:helix-turn-helix transcriptional regulator [Gemmatimonadales bacterium]
MVRETLGERVRRARLQADLSLRELARRLKITPSYLSDIEHDRRVPSEPVLRAISHELSLDVDELITLSGRLGEEAERYLRQSPAAATLLRRISQSRLGEEQVARLAEEAERLGRKARGKR